MLKQKHTRSEIPQPVCFWGSQTRLVFSPLLWSTPTSPPGLLGIDGVEPRFALWALRLHHTGCGVCPLLLWCLCPHLSWTCGDPSPSYYGNTRIVFVSVPVVILSRLPGMPFPLLFIFCIVKINKYQILIMKSWWNYLNQLQWQALSHLN